MSFLPSIAFIAAQQVKTETEKKTGGEEITVAQLDTQQFDFDTNTQCRAVYRILLRIADVLQVKTDFGAAGSPLFNYPAFFSLTKKEKPLAEGELLRCFRYPAYVVTRAWSAMQTRRSNLSFTDILIRAEWIEYFLELMKYFYDRIGIESGREYVSVKGLQSRTKEIGTVLTLVERQEESSDGADREVTQTSKLFATLYKIQLERNTQPLSSMQFFVYLLLQAMGLRVDAIPKEDDVPFLGNVANYLHEGAAAFEATLTSLLLLTDQELDRSAVIELLVTDAHLPDQALFAHMVAIRKGKAKHLSGREVLYAEMEKQYEAMRMVLQEQLFGV
jgi:hypothetical protein